MVLETIDTCTDVMEPLFFCNISAQMIGKSKPSQMLPVLNIIAKQWNYDLRKPIDNICAKRTLIQSVINN